ncbi:hypothetical protein FOL47_000978, partial [Perkinsus chesapeaki]
MPVVTRRRSYAPGDDVEPVPSGVAPVKAPVRRRSTGGSRAAALREKERASCPLASRVLQERPPIDQNEARNILPVDDGGSSHKPSDRTSSNDIEASPPTAAPPTEECTPRKSPSSSGASEPLTPGTILLREYTKH